MNFPASLPHLGEWAALSTSVCWTIGVLAFESAARKVGALVVNLFRLTLAFCTLALLGLVTSGHVLPMDVSGAQWGWLLASGLIGLVIGDLCLVRAFVLIGSRLSLLVYATVPIFTTLLDYWFFDVTLGGWAIFGMALTVAGVASVSLERRDEGPVLPRARGRLSVWGKGVALALTSALAQSIGLMLSKPALPGMNPFSATQIRMVSGMLGFAVIAVMAGYGPRIKVALQDGSSMWRIGLGTIFGPVVGVTLSLLALQHTNAGVASTLMSLMPVLVIAPSMWLFKERPSLVTIVGAVLAVSGTAVIFL